MVAQKMNPRNIVYISGDGVVQTHGNDCPRVRKLCDEFGRFVHVSCERNEVEMATERRRRERFKILHILCLNCVAPGVSRGSAWLRQRKPYFLQRS